MDMVQNLNDDQLVLKISTTSHSYLLFMLPSFHFKVRSKRLHSEKRAEKLRFCQAQAGGDEFFLKEQVRE